MNEVQSFGLVVKIDGAHICIACADEIANKNGYYLLFWMMNKTEKVVASNRCASCGERIDNLAAQEAADRVAKFFEAEQKQ